MARMMPVDRDSSLALEVRAHLAAVRAGRCPKCMGHLREIGADVSIAEDEFALTGQCGSCGLVWTARWGRPDGFVQADLPETALGYQEAWRPA